MSNKEGRVEKTFSMNTDKKTFTNPSGYWSYFGIYIVEVTDDCDKTIALKNPRNKVDGNKIIVPDGSLGQSIGGISMKDSMEHNFHWGYHWIKSISKENGDLIWVNNNYRNS